MRLKCCFSDGGHGTFYHKHWEIIHKDIQGFTAEFFTRQAFPKPLNSTQIILIPKVLNPEAISQFRLISMCNFSYKILSKILANYIKPHLPNIISTTQNAFVPDRQTKITSWYPTFPHFPLFPFISEVFSLLIKNACETNLLQCIKLNLGGITLSHLLFADDTLIFLKAIIQNCQNISHLL